MQLINFATMATCKPLDLLPKLELVANFIHSEAPDFKALKRFFKEHDLYEKERFDVLLNFIGIDKSDTKQVKPGPLLKQLLKAQMPNDKKRALFDYMTDKNPILMKYVFENLATRLFSTNELYRYITSYVYPGTYITLVDFRAWIAWLQASDHIRLVGIRWGLSELGKTALDTSIKLIDIEDILEEERDGSEEEDEEEEEEEDVSSPNNTKKESNNVEETRQVDSTPIQTIDEFSSEHEVTPVQNIQTPKIVAQNPTPALQTLTPQITTTKNSVPIEVALQETITESRVEIIVQPIATKTEETPLQLVKQAFQEADDDEEENEYGDFDSAPKVQIEKLRLDPALVADNVRSLQFWWRNRPGGKILTAQDYGFTKENFEQDPSLHLFRLSALALQLLRFQGRLNVNRGGQSFALLDQMGLFQNLLKSRKSIDTILDELLKGGLAQHADYFCNLHFILIIRRAIKALKEEGIKSLLAAENITDLVNGLWKELGSYQLTYEILWITRELGDLGVITTQGIETIGAIPFPRVRENAFRLGLIETPYAADFTHLIAISKRISKFFGRNDAWEAPLMYFEPKRILHYDSSEPAFFTRDQLGID